VGNGTTRKRGRATRRGRRTRGEMTQWRTRGNDEDEERNVRAQDGLIEQSQPRVGG